MANFSLTSCQDLPLPVNTVPYRPDVKTSIVTVFTCVFIGLACPCAIVANLMVFLGVLRKPDLRNVYNTSILFLATSDLLAGLITLPSFVAYQGSKLTTPQHEFSCVALVMYTFTKLHLHRSVRDNDYSYHTGEISGHILPLHIPSLCDKAANCCHDFSNLGYMDLVYNSRAVFSWR